MSVIIHMADLHLSVQESTYALAVLAEILSLAARHRADFIIMAGDTFDSYADAYALRAEFRKQVAGMKSKTEILFLPGNHEFLQGGNREKLASLDLGNITLLSAVPYMLLERGAVEFLAIPHQAEYKEYRDWKVKAKDKNVIRIALAHGEISGMSFTGVAADGQSEEEAGVIDPDLFDFFGVDYAALGHIHAGRSVPYNKTQMCYPGSARVWRRGESGVHGVQLVKTGQTVTNEFLPLAAAGEFRAYKVPVSFEGIPEWEAEANTAGTVWKAQDWIECEFTGIVENEKAALKEAEKWEVPYRQKVRRLDLRREGLSVFAGIAAHPLARKFIRLWKSREPDPGNGHAREVWFAAREQGLAEIMALLEARE